MKTFQSRKTKQEPTVIDLSGEDTSSSASEDSQRSRSSSDEQSSSSSSDEQSSEEEYRPASGRRRSRAKPAKDAKPRKRKASGSAAATGPVQGGQRASRPAALPKAFSGPGEARKEKPRKRRKKQAAGSPAQQAADYCQLTLQPATQPQPGREPPGNAPQAAAKKSPYWKDGEPAAKGQLPLQRQMVSSEDGDDIEVDLEGLPGEAAEQQAAPGGAAGGSPAGSSGGVAVQVEAEAGQPASSPEEATGRADGTAAAEPEPRPAGKPDWFSKAPQALQPSQSSDEAPAAQQASQTSSVLLDGPDATPRRQGPSEVVDLADDTPGSPPRSPQQGSPAADASRGDAFKQQLQTKMEQLGAAKRAAAAAAAESLPLSPSPAKAGRGRKGSAGRGRARGRGTPPRRRSASRLSPSPEPPRPTRPPPGRDASPDPDVRKALWEPPVSPFNLIEEQLFQDPWRLLVACMLLNKTTGRAVRKIMWQLFQLAPTPEAAAECDPAVVEDIIRPLGLHRKRALMFRRFSQEYLNTEWSDPQQLYGIGRYAADAYFLFCRNQWRARGPPEDKDLRKYYDWLLQTDCQGSAFEREVFGPPGDPASAGSSG